jgi:hypothetical protein
MQNLRTGPEPILGNRWQRNIIVLLWDTSDHWPKYDHHQDSGIFWWLDASELLQPAEIYSSCEQPIDSPAQPHGSGHSDRWNIHADCFSRQKRKIYFLDGREKPISLPITFSRK